MLEANSILHVSRYNFAASGRIGHCALQSIPEPIQGWLAEWRGPDVLSPKTDDQVIVCLVEDLVWKESAPIRVNLRLLSGKPNHDVASSFG